MGIDKRRHKMNIYQDNLPPFKPYMIGLLIFMGIFFFIVRGCIAEEINLDAIAFIESNNDSLAYNQTSEARGLYQITPVCLEEYNNYNRTDYTKADLFSEGINKEIAIWYITIRIPQMLRYFNKERSIRNILISYNAGINYVVKNLPLPKETIDYIDKYNWYNR